MRNPGPMKLIFSASSNQPIKGLVNLNLNITRIVAGLTLPVRCILAAGHYIGSCNYTDMCVFLNNFFDYFNENKCPQFFIDNGFGCKCPFDLPTGDLNLYDTVLNLPDFSSTVFSFLSSGNFDFSIKTRSSLGDMLCLNMKFTMKK